MGSHVLDILRQGILASLTGGWFYDPHLSIFINTFHLYLWMFLLAFPLILHLTLPPSLYVWGIYCGVVALVFIIVKVLNYKLHYMFDTCEVIEETVDDKDSKKGDSTTVPVELCSQEPPEAFEMMTMTHEGKVDQTPDSQTDGQTNIHNDHGTRHTSSSKKKRSKREDVVLSLEPKSLVSSMPSNYTAPLAEMDRDDIDSPLQGATGGTSRTIIRHHSNTDHEEEDTPSDLEDDLSIPNTITTQADVEAEPSDSHRSLPDDSLHQYDVKSPTESKHSCDADLSDFSPEHINPRPKKTKRKPQRAKSAFESSNLPSKHSSDTSLRSRPSLPARPKLQSVINKDTGVSIIRPWSDQTISRTKKLLESDEITVIDFEVMNNVAKAYQTRGAATAKKEKDKARLAESIDEANEVAGESPKHKCNQGSVNKNSNKSDQGVDTTLKDVDCDSVLSSETENHPFDPHSNKHGNSDNSYEKSTESSNTPTEARINKETFDPMFCTPQVKFRTRNAVSEERHLDRETPRPISSSHPIIKIGSSMLSSSSDESDLSLGEVVITDKPTAKTKHKRKDKEKHHSKSNKNKNGEEKEKVKVKTRTKHDKKRRPNSAEYVREKDSSSVNAVSDKSRSKSHSSQPISSNDPPGQASVAKPKDIGFARVSKMLARAASDRSPSRDKVASVPSSEQSSTVGLDWLFSTDSDSSDTRSHPDAEVYSITSSTVSIDDSLLDQYCTEHEQPVFYDVLNESDTLGSPSSPSTDELETLRKQGAIPKHFHKPLPPLPEPALPTEDIPDTKASSPASFDLSDPEEFHRKLIEILNEPAETSTEQLKKFMAVMEAKKNKSSSVKSKSEKEGSAHSGATPGTSKQSDDHDHNTDPKPPGDTEDPENKSSESKPVTPTEISSLLPDNHEPRGVHRQARKPVRKRRKKSSSSSKRDGGESPPPVPVPGVLSENSHLADNHTDTTDGATHVFQDEDGNWLTYTFGTGTGVAQTVDPMETAKNWKGDRWSLSSCASDGMVVLDSLKDDDKQMSSYVLNNHGDLGLRASTDIRMPRGILQRFTFLGRTFSLNGYETLQDLAYVDQLLENGRRFDSGSDTDSKDADTSHETPEIKHFYKFKVFPKTKKFLKIYFDRLALLALLDRHLTVIENCIAVIMSVLVGALGALVLAGNFYYDFYIFVFCFILAGCQYSLLKSVQPDAASPMHGYNHLIVFSRPFYFCVCCGLMLCIDYVSQGAPSNTVYVYGLPFTTSTALFFARDFFKVFLLCLPLVFTIGLLPQVNTFLTYVLEQIDTHLFGGNATVSLISAVYCFCRSVITAGFLYVICYLTLIQLGKTIVDEPNACKNPEFAQTAAFSIFCAVLVALSYHLSRSASDPSVLWMLIKDKIFGEKEEVEEEEEKEGELKDPLPGKLKTCVSERLQSDLLISIVIMILSFAIHVSTVFIQPMIDMILYFAVAGFGFFIHYVIPQLRKEMPWLCCSHPIFKSQERNMFEATNPAKIMWFEKLYIWMRFIERNGMYTVVVLCALTRSVPEVICKFGDFFGPLVLTICSMKLLRFTFSNTPKQHMILAFTVLFFKYDLRWATETMIVDYFFIAIIFMKFCDLYLKMKFIITYIAPWQITWGSAFHAFAQPFSVPHSAMLFLQAGVSALFSTPLNPFLGSAIFITSYVRPIKFWEKDYNTKRVDHSNTRLSQQLERNTGADDNNLNSIFYEHLTRSLQHSLCGDLVMGRWGNAEQGDIFIMASDSLNALVHIIEMGNGLVTFQLRGLEFRGTYCQQREVEAITEGIDDNEGFCCFEPGHLPHFLSLNAAFNQRWLSWEVVVTKYVLEGYSISDNNAASMVGVFDFRKVLIVYYVQSIIYYTVRSPRLEQWLENPTIMEALVVVSDDSYCDVDPTFSVHVDDDYDSQNSGISRKSFCNRNLDWIQYCASRREKAVDNRRDSALVSLCFALSLLGRRALGTASHNNASASVEFFLYGLHALFKGDFRITSSRDEWVFADMELLRRVVSPGVRMSLKLHQDHFLMSDAYESEESLYDAISHYETNLVISHEADPSWRNAVLSNTPSLLALRNVFDEGSDEYKIIMLNKRYLTFRIVKVNRECVRGLWAGQQQELIFLRNRNPERGSIQNAKQALRNMINSSCDQPIGYPIYVSPLTTSYSSTNEQYTSVIGGEFIIDNVKRFFKNTWQGLRRHCGASCTSGSSGVGVESVNIPYSCTHQAAAAVLGSQRGCPTSTPTNTPGDTNMNSLGNRGSLISTTSSAASKPRSLVTLTGLLGEGQQKEAALPQRVKIIDTNVVYDNINLGRRIDVQWPNEDWRNNGGKNAWSGWYPAVGMEGTVIHRWSPCHRDIQRRSHVDKTILLVQVGDKYVPVCDIGVQDAGLSDTGKTTDKSEQKTGDLKSELKLDLKPEFKFELKTEQKTTGADK